MNLNKQESCLFIEKVAFSFLSYQYSAFPLLIEKNNKTVIEVALYTLLLSLKCPEQFSTDLKYCVFLTFYWSHILN